MNGVQRRRKRIAFDTLPERTRALLTRPSGTGHEPHRSATYAVNGWNIGAYWRDTNANGSVYTIAGKNIGKSTGTVFLQKTF
jgi:hypothetical protein